MFACAGWLFLGKYDLSTATLIAATIALTLGSYAAAGAVTGRGRSDIAYGALFLAVIALLLWAWIGRPTPLVRPT